MRNCFRFLTLALIALSGSLAQAQFLQPLSSFGVSAPGWLAPGDHGFNNNSTLNVLRGMAYHSPSNRLIVVDRAGGLNVRLLDGDTGIQVGTLDSSNVTGGTFPANMVGVADDGHVYMGNLVVGSTFKIYRWDSSEVSNPTSAPTVAFDGASGRTRTGDSFAVTGAGANTRIVSAGGSGAGEAFALFTSGDGLTYTVSNPTVTGVPVGGFRLGIDFDGSGNVVGKTSGSTDTFSVSETGGAATTFNVADASETALAFYAPLNLLATIQFGPVPIPTGGPGDVGVINTVRLYDASDINNLVLLDAKNLTNIAVGNGNGVGAVSFGLGPDGDLRLYALNTNNGIQAFRIVPEPSAGLLALFAGLLAVRRRRAV